MTHPKFPPLNAVYPLTLARALALAVGALCLFGLHAEAQLSVSLTFERSSFLVDERAIATLKVTNLSGQELVLEETRDGGAWCQIEVSAVQGASPSKLTNTPTIVPVYINSGETIARSIDVNALYSLSNPGQYRVKARINYGENTQFITPPVYFTMEPGKTIWTMTVGVPQGREGSGNLRAFSVVSHQRKEGVFLFARLEDKDAGWRYPPYPLGRVLTAMEPQSQLDRDNNLYVFHATSDDSYVLSQLDVASGRFGQALYRSKTPRAGRPRLERQPDGRLVIAGGLRVSEEEIAAQKSPNRARISERPDELPTQNPQMPSAPLAPPAASKFPSAPISGPARISERPDGFPSSSPAPLPTPSQRP